MMAIEQDIKRAFLYEACVELGFCLPPAVQDRILQEHFPGKEALVECVMTEEGLDPIIYSSHFKSLLRLLEARISSN